MAWFTISLWPLPPHARVVRGNKTNIATVASKRGARIRDSLEVTAFMAKILKSQVKYTAYSASCYTKSRSQVRLPARQRSESNFQASSWPSESRSSRPTGWVRGEPEAHENLWGGPAETCAARERLAPLA